MILEDLTMDEWMDLRYEEGLEQGIATGREEGMERGIEQSSKQIARNLLAEGSTIEFVQKTTGLPIETIQTL
ncbi:MAG: hypothetical protein LBU88_06205 [Treponema sp.]|jgi:predicted transposase/invertase (TIGR01784 family)|nr:hypothetical protein [Treponema sp.]